MQKHTKSLVIVAALAACGTLFGGSDWASAQDGPTMALPAPQDYTWRAEMVSTQPAEAVTPCIVYRTHRGAKKMYRCSGEKEVIMVTNNPADCCDYEIPLCIPCCCEGMPTVTSECGLGGRGVVEYCWECGFTAKVVFRVRGDVKVSYRG
jgi:hypothetical protein